MSKKNISHRQASEGEAGPGNSTRETVQRREAVEHATSINLLRQALLLLGENAEPSTISQLSTDVVPVPKEAEADLARAAEIAERVRDLRKRESELNALYDTARDITALRDTEELLRAIAQRARRLVGVDIAYISSLEGQGRYFIVRATEGIVSDGFEAMRVPPDYGLCGQVAATRRACYSSNYLADMTFYRNDHFDTHIRSEGIVSMLGVPLEISDQVIGVLLVGDRFTRTYTPREIAILSSLATLAALAIHNSRLYEDAKASLTKERELNHQLCVSAAETHAATEAHEQMISFIARGGDLQGLASLVAKLLKGRVCVFDNQLRTLCSVGNIRGCREEPSLDLEIPAFRTLINDALRESRTIGRSTVRKTEEGVFCRVAPILAGTDQFGGLVIKRDVDMSESEARTLERSAMVSAIVLLANERLAHVASRDAYDTVSSLLRDPLDQLPSFHIRIGAKGSRLSWPLTLLLLEIGTLRPGQILQPVKALIARASGIASEYNGYLVVLVQMSNPGALAAKIQNAIEQETGTVVSIAIADPASEASELPLRYRAAQQSLRMLRLLGHRGQIAQQRHFAIYSSLFAKGGDEIEAFVETAIGPLTEYDHRRQSVLAPTLLAYLDNSHRLQRTADVLSIHINTLRQRLSTVGEICAGWDNPARLLETHLALKLHLLTAKSETYGQAKRTPPET